MTAIYGFQVVIIYAINSNGGENRIIAYNPYYITIYVLSIFRIPTNLPSDLLDLNERYWTTINVNVFYCTKQTFKNISISQHLFQNIRYIGNSLNTPILKCPMNQKIFLKQLVSLVFFIITNGWLTNTLASEHSLIEGLHNQPPEPCVSKSTNDRSSLIAISPKGKTREEIRDHMGAIASIFLSSGSNYMTSKYIETIYSAVFYEKEPINEVGIYGYRFKESIDPNLFESNSELNGRLFVFNNKLLVILWHEDIRKTGQCFTAIEKTLLKYIH